MGSVTWETDIWVLRKEQSTFVERGVYNFKTVWPRGPVEEGLSHLPQVRPRSRDAYSNVLDGLLHTIIPEAIVNPEAYQLQGWLGPKHVLSRHV